jgi:hypothetical protein
VTPKWSDIWPPVAAILVFVALVFTYKAGWDRGSSEAFGAAANGQMQLRAADPTCEKARDGGDYGMRCHKIGTSLLCSDCLGPKAP